MQPQSPHIHHPARIVHSRSVSDPYVFLFFPSNPYLTSHYSSLTPSSNPFVVSLPKGAVSGDAHRRKLNTITQKLNTSPQND